jgi:hypothetical protein
MSTSPDQIVLTPAQQQRLAELANETGKPWHELLDAAISSLKPAVSPTNGQETVYDAMVRLGLLGCLKGGPADLSTNPIYMEGFGEGGR